MPLTRSSYFSLLPILACHAIISQAVAPTVIDLEYARYQGTFNQTSKTTQFLGIRYAAPPTDALRWMPPRPPAIVTGIQKADTAPPPCFMAGPGTSPVTPFRRSKLLKRASFSPSEDCLFLNVYSPGQPSQRATFPVIVFIHGGGYMEGSASGFTGTDIYDGNNLINTSHGGVVVVVIQYRLGVFGFLPGRQVKKRGALNVGLLDQQFALQWVQKNIGKFNGDPTRVTIWGQSAGAGSVLQHIVANGGETSPSLFKAAITSSTYLPSQYHFDDRIPEILYNQVVSQTNCSSFSNSLACLRQVDAQMLEEINVKIGNNVFFGTFVFVPVVDGELIRERPTEALRKRKVNGDVILTATNTFEGTMFVDRTTSPDVDVSNYVAQLFPEFTAKETAAAVAQYRTMGSPKSQVVAIIGEAIYICPTYYLLTAFSGRGYKSEFAIPPGLHGDDLAYYFPSTGFPLNFKNSAFTRAFSESFVDFVMALDPNIKSRQPENITPQWDLWAGGTEMLFNMTNDGEPDVRAIKTSDALLERCKFWESVARFSGQ